MEKAETTNQRKQGLQTKILSEEDMKQLMAKAIEKFSKSNQKKNISNEEVQAYIVAKITRFIKHNNQLIHFDLSHTGLNE